MPITPAQLDAIARRVAAYMRKGEGSAYDTGPAPTLHAVLGDDGAATGAYRVEQDGEALAVYDSVFEALRAVEETAWFTDAVARKKPDELAGDGALAEGRWFDAARQEDLPAVQGGQITRESIDEMVRNLAGLARAPIVDGGMAGSEPHGSLYSATNTPASGFVLGGVRSVDEAGDWHLWLYARLVPEVDAAIDSRAFVYGSIGFLPDALHPYTGEEIGTRLISYALTSEPYQDGLMPHRARADLNERLREEFILLGASLATHTNDDGAHAHVRTTTLRRTQTMPKNSPKIPAVQQRGPAAELLTSIAALLKVDLSTMDQEAMFALSDNLYALVAAAKVEDIVDGDTPPPAEGEGDRTQEPPAPATPAPARAVEGLEGEALDAWGMDLLTLIRGIFEQPEATPEQALEMMGGAAEAFAAELSKEPPPADNAGEGGQEQEEMRTAKAANIGLRSTVAAQESELVELRAFKRDGEIRAFIVKRYADAKRPAPAGEHLEELLDLCRGSKDYEKLVNHALRTVNTPPAGVVTNVDKRTPAQTGGEPASTRDAIARCEQELKDRGETLTSKQRRAKAYQMAKSRHADLFRAEAHGRTASGD
jgi:hypothetical protein